MKIVEIKNCLNDCGCNRNEDIKWAIVFNHYILTVCDKCLEELRNNLQEGDIE
jgi:hypothetical protein